MSAWVADEALRVAEPTAIVARPTARTPLGLGILVAVAAAGITFAVLVLWSGHYRAEPLEPGANPARVSAQ